MHPELVKFMARKIIGIGNIGKPSRPEEAWPALFARIDQIPGRVNRSETLGVIPRDEYGYLAGVETALSSKVPEGMSSYIIPAGEYAYLRHKGPLSQINETFEELIAWLRKNDYEQFDVVCFDVYDERFKGEQPESEIDMYIQIK